MTKRVSDRLNLPGGVNPEELATLRRLERELIAAGYRVVEVAISAGGEPAALVYAATDVNPIKRVLVAARSILRLVSEVPIEVGVTAEEYETLQALRVTATRLAKNAGVEQGGRYSVGDVARLDLARHVDRGSDLEGD